MTGRENITVTPRHIPHRQKDATYGFAYVLTEERNVKSQLAAEQLLSGENEDPCKSDELIT